MPRTVNLPNTHPLVGQTIRLSYNKAVVPMKIEAEEFEYGKRFYKMRDPSNESHQFDADVIDRQYGTGPKKKIAEKRGFNARYKERWRN